MTQSFPLNAWYAACWDAEATRNLLSRTICGKKIVLYRRLDGHPVALDDACWHRLVPLSQGKLDGDNVICGYHGLVFEPGGRCIHMPSQEMINPSACVRSYPVVVRHRLVWIWTGDPALADASKVPDLHWQDDSNWVGDIETLRLPCNYRLVLDNLMDLTHETFVHAGSIGDASVAETPFSVTHSNDTVTVTRWMLNVDPPPFLKKQLGKPGNVDRWQIITFQVPSSIVIDGGVALAGTGAPEGDRSQGINHMVVNTVTPESESSCLYFWSFPRNYRIQDERLTKSQHQNVSAIFRQDEVVLTAQQKAIDENPDKEFYNLNIDAGAMWVRRILAARVEQDSARGLSKGTLQVAPAE
ncbi:aromatic ring-hydroxylating dioxygenase subunit alpha [Bradyrhizobium sp. 186]|uniref:aromatic ring-hydroxylating dioxygenase subunit alpha n=1 Tax=Bradyrhizobium sp. 186 TaxID=2782654 RepID=UPI002000F22D|nr:aromatic ring-hydroxylating dioxygenase subunit alpha [Bradyrhizobium sp. 186]UPK38247.1 aromatic ring-hydroxylating dioxygenase subunit alpha [Bradyrhizobium sp. 186]